LERYASRVVTFHQVARFSERHPKPLFPSLHE
jgi:hypothetical protein